MLSLSENPPILAGPMARTVLDLQGRWWIGHTKSRFEKTLAHKLLQQQVGYFLPLLPRVTVAGGKKRRSLIPMFPSYVFFCGTPEDRVTALSTKCLCRVLEVPEQETFVRELVAIERAMAHASELEPYPFAAVGRRCRVIGGSFEGVEGIVVAHKKRARIVLQVSMLRCGASLEVDADLLEPVDGE
jgi:transcription antitermination factor NusG